jgi:hypothetical protein
MGETRNTYKNLIGIPEGKRPHRRPRCTGEDNIKMDLRETKWNGVEWMQLVGGP